jgi:RNA polymerase sigma-70 factor (ECF subfamily)
MRKDMDHEFKRQFAQQWTRVQPIVASYVRSMILSFHDAEDVIQEVAVAFAVSFERYDPERPVVPWVLSIARHKVVDYVRSAGKTPTVFDEKTLESLAHAYDSVQDESQEIQQALLGCTKKLNKRPRHVVNLRYMRDMSVGEIAQRLGMSNTAVYVMLHRVKDVLAECVQRKLNIEWKIS